MNTDDVLLIVLNIIYQLFNRIYYLVVIFYILRFSMSEKSSN